MALVCRLVCRLSLMGGASLLVQLYLLPINVTLATVSPIKLLSTMAAKPIYVRV